MMKRASTLTGCILVMMISQVSGQSCPEPVGHWGYGPHHDAAWYGELALIPSGPKLLVVDFRLGAPQSIVGEVRLPGTSIALAVDGEIAVVGVRRWPPSLEELLVAVDLSDPANPAVLDGLEIARAMSDVAIHESVAYVTSLSEGLVLIDVSDPARLRRLSRLATVDQPESVVARNGFAYLGNFDGLITVDVTNPSGPLIASTQIVGGFDAELALSEGHLFLLSEDELVVYGLSTPERPIRLGAFDPSGSPSAVDVAGSIAFVVQYHGGGERSMAVIDTTDPLDLRQIGEYDLTSRTTDVAASDGTVLLSMGTLGTQLVDVSDPAAPQLFVELPPPARPTDVNDVAVDGGRAYIADTGGVFGATPPFGGLRIIDVSEPGEPREISSLGLDEPARQVAYSGDHVLVLRGQEEITPMTIEVVDVSDPSLPAVVGSLQLSGPPWGEVVVSGDHAYITDNSLNIVDLADPTNPVLVSREPAGPGFGNALAVVGDRAYIVGHLGLCIIDVSDPADPVEVSFTSTGGPSVGVSVRDEIVFVSVRVDVPSPRWIDELRLFDISDETTPVEIASIKLWGAAGRVSIEGDLLSVEVLGRGLLVIDISDPREPKTVGLARVGASGTIAAGRIYAASGYQGLDLFDCVSCLSPAPSPDFVWSLEEPTLGEEVEFTDISPGAPTSWSWEFGDGGTSADQHPGHSFTTPGLNTVTLTASNAHGSTSSKLAVSVQSIADSTWSSSIVPAAAHADGKAGTRWRTDLTITSTDDAENDVVLYFMKEGEDNTLRHGRRVSLPPGVTVFEDVVATVFGEDDASGAIFFQSRAGWISSRTYTLSDDGSFGQFIPAVYHRSGRPIERLIQLTHNDDFRTNLGLVNRLGTPMTVDVLLSSSDNTKIAETAFDVEPFGHLQIDGFIAELTDEPFEDGYLSLYGGRGGDLIAYASTVDNITGDPVFMLPPTPSDEPLWIAAVAHVAGRNGTVWRTDLEVCAHPTVDAEYRLEFFESNQSNPAPPSESFTLDAGHCVRYADVVRSVFDARTTGALRVVPVSGLVMAGSRTYTRRADGGTYGQHIAAVSEGELSTWSLYSRLAPVSQSCEPTEGFRTNVGFVNADDLPALVLLEVRGTDDRLLFEIEIELQPFEHRQLDRFLDGITVGEDLVKASIVVQTGTHPSRLLAYASVVDNATGDSMFLPAR